MERSRTALVFLLLWAVLFVSPVTPVFAAGDDDLLPGEPINSPMYEAFSKDAYYFDFVAPTDTEGWTEDVKIAMIEFLTLLLNLWWKVYMFFVELVIRLVNWAYDIELFESIFRFVENMMPSLEQNIWVPFWFSVSTIGIAAAVIYFAKGRNDRSLQTIGAIILILGIAPVMFGVVPKSLNTANQWFTILSGEIMTNLVRVDQKDVYDEIYSSRFNLKELGLGTPAEEARPPFKEKPATGLYSPFISPTLQQKLKLIKGIHAVDDSIWTTMVVEPYMIANFGSSDVGKQYWAELLSQGTDEKKRDDWLQDKGQINEKGTTENQNFVIFTAAGFGERFYKVIMATVLPLIPLAVVLAGAISILLYKARAIGKTVVLVFEYLLSLYPGFGIGNAIRSTIGVFSEFLLAFFYSAGLAVFLFFWSGMLKLDLSFGNRILCVLILVVGILTGLQKVQAKLENIPGLDGGTIQSGSGGSNPLAMWMAGKAVGGVVGSVMNGLRSTTGWAGRKVAGGAGFAAKTGAKGALLVGGKALDYAAQTDVAKAGKNKVMRFFKPQEGKLSANLSDEARKVYSDMISKNMNPESPTDTLRYKFMNPAKEMHVNELQDWINQEPYFQIEESGADLNKDVVPPSPPSKSSPEYIVWKNSPQLQKQWELYEKARRQVHQEAYQKYASKKASYEKNLLKRIFLRRPTFKEPSQRKYMARYHNLLKKELKEQEK